VKLLAPTACTKLGSSVASVKNHAVCFDENAVL
jgi:hypothetical protein